MKFYAQVSTVYSYSENSGWRDHDVVVEANDQKDARRIVKNWARRKPISASQIIINLVTKQQFENSRSGKIIKI